MAKEEVIVEKKEKVETKKGDVVTTAVYKTYLHCPQCAHDIKKPLLRTPGVHSVDVKFEKGEITVKGVIDEKKIHKRIEKLSKKKVEILPAPAKAKEVEKIVKDTKQTKVETTTMKAYMHCNKCEEDLRRKLLNHKGIHNVKTDFKAQTLTVEGTIESEKLVEFMKKKVLKHAEIIPPKQEKKEEKKEKAVTVEVKTTEITKIVDVFKEDKKVEAKTADGKVPYFVHYVYAPQLFSDENPNACSIM